MWWQKIACKEGDAIKNDWENNEGLLVIKNTKNKEKCAFTSAIFAKRPKRQILLSFKTPTRPLDKRHELA